MAWAVAEKGIDKVVAGDFRLGFGDVNGNIGTHIKHMESGERY